MRKAMMRILVVTVAMVAMQLCCQVSALAYGAAITLSGTAHQDVPWPCLKPAASYVCVNGKAGNWKVNCNWLSGKWQVKVPSNCSYWVTAYSSPFAFGPMKSVSIQVSIPDYKWYLPWTWSYSIKNDLLVPYQ